MGENSDLKKICAGVHHCSVGVPVYLVFNDIQQSNGVVAATFNDEAASLATDQNIQSTTNKFQIVANNVTNLIQKWRIKLNEKRVYLLLPYYSLKHYSTSTSDFFDQNHNDYIFFVSLVYDEEAELP